MALPRDVQIVARNQRFRLHSGTGRPRRRRSGSPPERPSYFVRAPRMAAGSSIIGGISDECWNIWPGEKM